MSKHGQSTGRRIQALKRRLAYLEHKLDTQGGSPRDIGEASALKWAIVLVENAYRLGIHRELALISALQVRIVEGVVAGMTLDAIADELRLERTTVKESAGKLCVAYGCELHELPAAIATSREAAA